MKDLTLLIWLTQFGLSVACPPVVCILLSVWLKNRFDLGSWVIWVGTVVGILFAIDGLRTSLRLMQKMSRRKKEDPPPLSFNDHD